VKITFQKWVASWFFLLASVSIALAAGWQPAIISGPNDASGPVNGLNATTARVEFFTVPDCEDEHAAAVAKTVRTAAAAASARTRVRDLGKGMCGCLHSVPIYVNILRK